MIEIVIGRIIVIIITVGLVSFVAARAWHHLPARMFVLFAVPLVLISSTNILQEFGNATSLGLLIRQINIVLTGAAVAAMHLLVAALFVPEWWQGRRPIIWITLPYVVALVALTLDLLFGAGIFLTTIRAGALQGGELAARLTPIGYVLLTLFVAGSALPIIVLVTAFIRKAHNRRLIGVLVGIFCAALIVSSVPGVLRLPAAWNGTILAALLIIGPAYVVLSSDLLIPVRLASDLALRSMRDAVVVEGHDGQVLFANPAAIALGVTEGRSLRLTMLSIGIEPEVLQAIALAGNQGQVSEHNLMLADRQLEVLVAPIRARNGNNHATLIIGRDVTEAAQYTAQIEQERAQLDLAVQQLSARERERDQLTATIQSLALPLIPIAEGVLVLPVVGNFDQLLQGELAEVLLRGIVREHARLVLIDITGLHLLDTTGANILLEAVKAASLLGARCVLAGVRPEIAQALVSLGVSFGTLQTAATLQQALQEELNSTAHKNIAGRPIAKNLPSIH